MKKAYSATLLLLGTAVVVWCVILPFYWAKTVSKIAHSEYFEILPFYVPQLAAAALLIASFALVAYRAQFAIYGLVAAAVINAVLQFTFGSPTYGTWPITSGLPLLLAWRLHRTVKNRRAAQEAGV